MAERYSFKYLPLVGKLPGKSMVEQTETAINELASVVYDNVGYVGNLAEEVQTANTNASNALDKATEALETSGRVYIKQIVAVDVNDYYDSELYYINNDGSTNIPVRDRGFLEVKTNDDKTACEQVFIADSTGTPYYRHGRITQQTLGEETTYVVTWSSWYRVATTPEVLTYQTPKWKEPSKWEDNTIQSIAQAFPDDHPAAYAYGVKVTLGRIKNEEGHTNLYFPHNGGMCLKNYWGSDSNTSGWLTMLTDQNYSNFALPKNGTAVKATADAAGNNIQSTYAKKSDLTNYLPLSGGTMTTGNTLITMGNGESFVRNWGNGLYLGGTNKNNASSLILFTNSNASGFQLQAGDGTTFKRMTGKPDGTLTWDNKEIERVSAKGTYGIRLESGIQMCWGELTIPAGTADREVSGTMTFQYPFANTNYVLTFGNDWCASSSEYYRAEGKNTANFRFTAVGVGTNYHKAFYVAIGYWK